MKKLFLTIVLILVAFLGYAQINLQEPLELDKRVITGKLDNGLTYYVMHNDEPAQRAHFYLVTNVGAVQETPDQDGLAHFLEHMAFNGTKHFPGKGIISYMESLGCAFGYNINAATGIEDTKYQLMDVPVIREGIVDSSLLILYDWASFITNDPVEIDKERGVILEERRTSYDVTMRAWIDIQKAIFRGSAMENTSILGSEENLKSFKYESLNNFYKTWYRPDLQAVVVVGDIDADAVVNKIKNLFGQLPKADNPKIKEPVIVPDNTEPIISVFTDKEMDQTSVTLFAKEQPVPFQYRGLIFSMFNDIMEVLASSIINERLEDISREKKAPFLSAGGGFTNMSHYMDVFMVGANAKDGEGINAFKGLMTELERVKRYGFTPDELERAKMNLLKAYETEKNNAESRKNEDIISDLTYHFIHGYSYMDPAYEYDIVEQCLSMISLEMLNMAAKELYGDENLVISYYSPLKKKIKVPAEQEFLDVLSSVKTAEISAPESVSTNEPLMDTSILKGSPVAKTEEGMFGTTVWTLENGIQVYVKPTQLKKDEVLVSTVVNGGRSILTDDLIPSFVDDVFDCYASTAGLGDYKRSVLTKMLSGKVVYVSPYLMAREHGVTMYSSPKDLETAFQLAYLTYVRPRFDKDEFEAGFEQIKSIVPNKLKNPDELFSKTFHETIFNNSVRRPYLTEDLIAKVSLANIEKGYRLLMADQAGLKVYILGNVNLDELKPMVEKYIGSLPVISEEGTSWKDEGIDFPKGSQKKVFATSMETPKTTVGLFSHGEMKKSLENDIRMELLNNILFQLYTKTIREDEGGTYGVSAYGSISHLPYEEYQMNIGFDTDVAKAPKLIELAKAGLASIAEDGPDAGYLSKAKENLIKDFPEAKLHNAYWYNVVYEYYSHGFDNYTTYIETIEKVSTPESIQKFVQEMLSSGNVLEVVMNPAE